MILCQDIKLLRNFIGRGPACRTAGRFAALNDIFNKFDRLTDVCYKNISNNKHSILIE